MEMTRREFVERMEKAIAIAKEKGARVNGLAIIAQAALESDWGTSELARTAHNLFGIKIGKDWKGPVLELPTWEFSEERGWYRVVARWRKYPSWNECIVDYSNIIASRRWFQDALPYADPPDGNGEPESWLRPLLPDVDEHGWATDPDYLAKVRRVGQELAAVSDRQWPTIA
jgi:flagellar protein FlgJ